MKKLLKICAALSLSSAILVGQVFAQSESVLKYMVWSDSELERERPMIAAFEAANPGAVSYTHLTLPTTPYV